MPATQFQNQTFSVFIITNFCLTSLQVVNFSPLPGEEYCNKQGNHNYPILANKTLNF